MLWPENGLAMFRLESRRMQTVQMHRVSDFGPVIQDDSDSLCSPTIVNVPVRGKAGISSAREQQNRGVEVGAEGDAVHHPQPVSSCVLFVGEVNIVGDIRFCRRSDLEDGGGTFQGVFCLRAVGDRVRLLGRSGDRGLVGIGVVDHRQSIRLIGSRATSLDRGSHEVGSICESIGGDDDIESLGDSE